MFSLHKKNGVKELVRGEGVIRSCTIEIKCTQVSSHSAYGGLVKGEGRGGEKENETITRGLCYAKWWKNC